MKATVEKREKSRVSLLIEVEGPRVEQALQQVHRRLAQRVSVPGFRRGRVPRSVLERRLGLDTLVQEAVELLWPDVFEEAIEETGIDPVYVASIDLAEEYVAKAPLKIQAEVDVKPEVSLGDYKGLAVERSVQLPTEADVEAMLERARLEQAQLMTLEDASVETGHHVTIDFTGHVNGEPFSGGAGTDTVVIVGNDHLFEGLSEGLLGAQPGEAREIKVTLPERFNDLAGEEALLHVEVKVIQERQLPALDDEFAKDISNFDTLEELRGNLRTNMEEHARRQADTRMRNDLVTMASEQAELEIPDFLIEQQAREMINDGAMNLAAQGIDPRGILTPDYVQTLLESYTPEAEVHVRHRLVLEAIAETEGITVASEEIDERVAEWSEGETDGRAEEIRTYYKDPERRKTLSEELRLEKAIQFLVDNAEITEKVLEATPESDDDNAESGSQTTE